jgi:hypothetical protein
MMKNLIFLLVLLTFTTGLRSQTKNINPDPDGDPWIVGGLRELTPEDYEMLAKVPQWKPEKPATSKDLPLQVDNTINPWFRPVFSQSGGSCAQASGIGYHFTYEMDYERNLNAGLPENQYPTHYTWDFLNGGVGGGSWYFDGWLILKAGGCPTVAAYGGMAAGGDRRWMSGYDLYHDAMANRTLEFYGIDVSTYEGLANLKQWLWSRDGGTLPGGLANFAAGIGSATMSNLPSGTPQAGKPVIIQWGTTADHAMTFAGYDDEICYDFNNDGQYTTDIDINNDGVIDMRDCEIGGMLMVNSWGPGWGFGGKAYVMYKLLADAMEQGGIWNNAVHIVRAKPDAQTLVTVKTTIKHTSRNKLKIMAGIATNPDAEKPEFTKSFPMFNFQGGDYYMQGGNSNADKTIEIGLDITDLLTYVTPGQEARFFLQVVEQDPDFAGDGEVISFSIIDYTNGTEEVISDQTDIPIANNDTTLLWVNKAVDFNKVNIITEALDPGVVFEDYSYQLEAADGTAPYHWSYKLDFSEEQITADFPAITTNQLTPTNDDDGYVIQNINFNFPFYGKTYNELTVLTDGAITFDGKFSYIRDNMAIISNQCIAAYCSDLMIYPGQGDGMFYEGDDTHATFRWKTSKYDDPGFDLDAAITLFADGTIRFFYGDNITPSTDWGSGVSAGDGTSYLISAISGNIAIPEEYASEISCDPFPMGMNITNDGIFYGTPTQPDMTWNITFMVTDYNNISSLKTLVFTTSYVGTDEIQPVAEQDISVSPNPFSNHFNIRINGPADNYLLQLYNANGKKIQTVFDGYARQGTTVTLNTNTINGLTPGVYFLQWQGNSRSGTVKMIYSK